MKAKKLTKETIKDLGMYERSFPSFDVGDGIAVSLRIVEITQEAQDKINKLKRLFAKERGREASQQELSDEIAKKFSAKEKEGLKERLQVFEGDVIAKHNKGASSTFTVRKVSAQGVSVERILPVYSPMIESIKVVKKGDVRRAKLFYVRDRLGRSARLKEKVVKAADKVSAEHVIEEKAQS